MTDRAGNPRDRDQLLDELLARYNEAVDRGEEPDRKTVGVLFPELAETLASHFAAEEKLRKAARTLRQSPEIPLDKIRYFGDYELLEEIGRGGMGVVYKARQISLNRIVAVKMILPSRLVSERDVERFHREAELAASLTHPGIVRVYEIGLHRDQHYFSMEYVEGSNLAEKSGDETFAGRNAARYVAQVADAVHYAHTQKVLHRDLKPSNIIIDKEDRARITDFGLATPSSDDVGLTADGDVMGTPSYMSPEQAEADHGRIQETTDVYSLGAVLYKLLTGRPPFQAETVPATLRLVLEEEPVSPRQLNPSIPKDLETICLKCLAKTRSRRYPSAREYADDLRRWLKGEPILARPVSTLEKVWRWCTRNRMAASLIASVIVLLVVVAVSTTITAIAMQARQQDQLRSSQIQKAQAVRRRPHFASWSKNCVDLLGEAARIRIDSELRAEIAATLVGTDAQAGPMLDVEAASIAFDPSGRRLLFSLQGPQKGACMWDLVTGERTVLTHRGVGPVAFTRNGTALQLIHRSVSLLELYDLTKNSTLHTFSVSDFASLGPHHVIAPDTMVIGAEGRLAGASTALKDKEGEPGEKTFVWSCDDGRLVREVPTGATSLAFSADRTLLATGDKEGRITVWPLPTGTPIRLPRIDLTCVSALAFAATPDPSMEHRKKNERKTSGFWLPARRVA